MKSEEIRKRFLTFFEKRGHAIIPSASLVPENDPSVLFTTAGMQPLTPYLMGQEHPKGKRLVGIQKCVRTQDIEEIGDSTHVTFFEMMGNWSLGDYFKKDAIGWSYEFLTNKKEGLGLDPSRLYITVFDGNDDAPRDEESVSIWEGVGIDKSRIYFLEDNWWSPGDNGPCGPDTEIFYDLTKNGLGDMSLEEFKKADERQNVVEIWNNVFMEYEKKDGRVVGELSQKNVDTGAGLERITMVMQGKDNVFDTDLFTYAMAVTEKNISDENKNLTKEMRIIADHIRTAVFIVSDGVTPSNTDRGYILRRLIRRAVRFADILSLESEGMKKLIDSIVIKYENVYENVKSQQIKIQEEIKKEEIKFRATLKNGTKELEKIFIKNKKQSESKDGELVIGGKNVFLLFTTYGFPVELTEELARERGFEIDTEGFEKEMKKHKEISRVGAEHKFKGGLANDNEKTTMLHTATHLMLAGLRKYLGENVKQAGSNITEERIRFDFTYPEKIEREVLDKVEEYVNEAIQKKCKVTTEEMLKEDAVKKDISGSFWEKYPDTVTVYSVICKDGVVYSRELCGGPHIKNTGEIKGKFKIIKQKASSAGVRRVKAVLE